MLSETDNDTLQSLLSFFDDPGDWSYVFNYGSYGILNAEHTPGLRDWKRIVVSTGKGAMYSVLRLDSTPPMMWEAVRITSVGDYLIGQPEHYTIGELFELFRCG